MQPSPPLRSKPYDRRNFLTVVVGFFGAIWAVIALYPIYRFLRPPLSMLEKASVTSVTVGDVASVPEGQGQNFQFGSIPGIVTHTQDNQFHAFSAVCTHLGCTVQFRPDMQRIWCACHGGQYDPATGEVLAGPPPRPLPPLKVTIQDRKIVVSGA